MLADLLTLSLTMWLKMLTPSYRVVGCVSFCISTSPFFPDALTTIKQLHLSLDNGKLLAKPNPYQQLMDHLIYLSETQPYLTYAVNILPEIPFRYLSLDGPPYLHAATGLNLASLNIFANL